MLNYRSAMEVLATDSSWGVRDRIWFMGGKPGVVINRYECFGWVRPPPTAPLGFYGQSGAMSAPPRKVCGAPAPSPEVCERKHQVMRRSVIVTVRPFLWFYCRFRSSSDTRSFGSTAGSVPVRIQDPQRPTACRKSVGESPYPHPPSSITLSDSHCCQI